MYRIVIPDTAKDIISTLESSGFEAYVVGGCVRDSIMGINPHDWDICTSATPPQIIECFRTKRIIETGLKHGTVTIINDGDQYEVTTFRIDSEYSDNRHPDHVIFTSNIEEDLSRRDFSMNAIAYNDRIGLVDPFDGSRAIGNREIVCVGNPDDRFNEDGLRIMRALRFASVYDFNIDDETSNSIHKYCHLLYNISVERIQSELSRMLLGRNILNILLGYKDVIGVIIPELIPCIGFEQNNPYHQYTIYDHIAHAVDNYHGNELVVKLALLLHDIGKPQCYTEDERGGHFHGHGVPSHDIADNVMQRLRFDNKTRHAVTDLVLYHDSVIEPTLKTVRRWLNKIGKELFSQLLDIRMADIKAHAEGTQESRIERCNALRMIMNDIITQEQCFSLKDMNVNGDDIISIGVPEGKEVGRILKLLLDEVISGTVENDREVLLSRASCLIN